MELLNKCTYCGFESDLQREHVIPCFWLGERSYDYEHQWIVPACKQCNLLAGAKVFFSIPEKAGYIYKRYKSRFRKILKTPIWTEEELKDLDYKFRVMITESTMQKALLLRRISYIESVSTLEHGYLRPKWVEDEIQRTKDEYERTVKSLRRKKKVRGDFSL